jgi:hypothetical protein
MTQGEAEDALRTARILLAEAHLRLCEARATFEAAVRMLAESID